MTVIIGVNGFLGSQIAEKLSEKNANVTGVFHTNTDRIKKNRYTKLIPIDDLDTIEDPCSVVYLTSAFIPYSGWNTPDPRFVETNIQLVQKISEKFKNTRIVFCSSSAVYGIPTGILREDSSFNNPTLYGLSKLAGETIVRNHASYAIIRFSSLYGYGMNDSTFLPAIIQQAKEKKKITLFGDGSRKQDYIHISDAAEICIQASLIQDNEVLLGVNGKSMKNSEVAEIVQHHIPGTIIDMAGKDASPSFDYDNRKTVSIINYSAKADFSAEVKRIIQHEL